EIFQQSVAQQLLPQLREYGGKSHVVDPRWLEILKRVIGAIFGDAGAAPIEASRAEVANAISAKTALELVLQILEAANSIGRSSQVDCSVVWRYPTWTKLSKEGTKAWAPISAIGSGPGSSCAGVLWDRLAHQVWHWADIKPWPRNFQFTPNQLWRSLYPSGILAAAEPAEEPAPAPTGG
ncbi:MAG TPA: hypothetical protein VFJ53_05815, partial [Solirubrobacterales bacterium]|nr:hypothetical protein [Solirubrobacterales bacterium]